MSVFAKQFSLELHIFKEFSEKMLQCRIHQMRHQKCRINITHYDLCD